MIQQTPPTRDAIIEALRANLEPDPRILAFHLGGSAASGRLDQWSDIDAVVTVEDGAVECAFVIAEAAMAAVAPIADQHRMPEPTWHGHSQRFYALRGASPCNMIDLVVMQRSAPERFLEAERHGHATVLFDKADLIVPTHLDRAAHAARMQAHLDDLQGRFQLFRPLVTKALDRGHLAEAVHFYMSFSYRPLVDILRITHCPERFDFGARYLDRDVPPEARADLERLALVGSAEAIRSQHAEIGGLVAASLPAAHARIREFLPG